MSDQQLFVHSSLDDMTDVSPNAMRVYMHLSRRANQEGKAWPSYQSIGDHCFGCVSDNPITRRSFARKSIDELIEANLIGKEVRARDDGGQTSNSYVLIGTAMPIDTPQPISTPMPIDTGMPIDTPHAYKAPEDTPIEDTPLKKGEEEDTHARDDVRQTWLDCYEEELPANLDIPITGLIAETSEAAVIYGIKASVEAKARNFRYIAQCARNYIPVAAHVNGYHVDLTNASAPSKPPAPKPSLPPPMAHDDPWAIALAELKGSLPGVAASYLAGSRMEDTDTVSEDGKPIYVIVVESRAAAGLDWLRAQAGPAIRRKLTSLLGHPVLIEMSCEGEM